MLQWMHDVDVIVCPAMPQPAILHGGSNDPAFGDSYSDVHNLTGFPAVVVRGGTSPEGLPIGVQLVAGPWREDVALAAARVVEAASGGWRPPPSTDGA
jgi:amidase